ncbi:hypothetical protein [Bacillus cabrialesii]|uniref:hypothetical protein n=1 Tax=Bacillus cabrialesii TaxID=2487276 RepID=UPI0028F999DA|nr:hypothetical protein [Bacillus cabrialesii]MDU0155077.1 hypothetical protein [Bacillus cabrialesii]
MKRVLIFVTSLVLIASILGFSSVKAEAAMGNWHSIGSGCKVRVWVDAYTYSKSATSIDWYAQTNGKCSTLNYTASLAVSEGYSNYEIKGSFSNRTPTKKFYISKLRKEHFNQKKAAVDLYVRNSKVSGHVQSHTITVNW